MAYWLLTLREQSGGMEHETQYLVEASDPQQVKYEYHRVVESDYDVRQDPHDKHRLVDYDRGYAVNIQNIEALTDAEFAVMSDYLNHWN